MNLGLKIAQWFGVRSFSNYEKHNSSGGDSESPSFPAISPVYTAPESIYENENDSDDDDGDDGDDGD